jgi:hypothetical protein
MLGTEHVKTTLFDDFRFFFAHRQQQNYVAYSRPCTNYVIHFLRPLSFLTWLISACHKLVLQTGSLLSLNIVVRSKKNVKKPLWKDLTYKDDFQSFLRPTQTFVNFWFQGALLSLQVCHKESCYF